MVSSRPLQDVPLREGALVEVYLPPRRRPVSETSRSIGDLPFAGMWKDREDVVDSVEYINRLRRELHD